MKAYEQYYLIIFATIHVTLLFDILLNILPVARSYQRTNTRTTCGPDVLSFGHFNLTLL